jgi:hypothetical protein
VAAEVTGEDPSVEQSYRFGFHRLGSVLLVSVLVGLATVGGLILFVIPGIYIGVRLAVSIEALVVEGRRGTQAMGRSWELVRGHWWHAFGTLLVAALLTGLVNSLITAPFGDTNWFVQGLVAVATVVTLPYGVLVGVLLYLDLRARKESLTLESLRTDLRASATPDAVAACYSSRRPVALRSWVGSAHASSSGGTGGTGWVAVLRRPSASRRAWKLTRSSGESSGWSRR